MALETTSTVVGLALPAVKLIYKIMQATEMATQNKVECDDLAGRLSVMHKLLVSLRLEGPEVAEALSGLCGALKDAHELVEACKKWSALRKFAFSGDHAERFVKVNRRIDSHINLINFCIQVETTRGSPGRTAGRKRAVVKKVTKITLGIVLLCPILLIDGIADPWPG